MFKRLMPTRTQTKGPIADLDAIVAEAVPFKFQGKVHFIKPITVREFLRFTQANSAFLERLRENGNITAEELAAEYEGVIQSVCDTITRKHILQMEQAQVAALYQLIIDTVTGQVVTDGEGKKKRLRLPIYDSLPPISAPNAPENLAGR